MEKTKKKFGLLTFPNIITEQWGYRLKIPFFEVDISNLIFQKSSTDRQGIFLSANQTFFPFLNWKFISISHCIAGVPEPAIWLQFSNAQNLICRLLYILPDFSNSKQFFLTISELKINYPYRRVSYTGHSLGNAKVWLG